MKRETASRQQAGRSWGSRIRLPCPVLSCLCSDGETGCSVYSVRFPSGSRCVGKSCPSHPARQSCLLLFSKQQIIQRRFSKPCDHVSLFSKLRAQKSNAQTASGGALTQHAAGTHRDTFLRNVSCRWASLPWHPPDKASVSVWCTHHN